MSKEDAIEVMAVVLEPLPNAMFRVSWRTSTWSGARFREDAQESPHSSGDKVAVELSPYDLNRGRIVYRQMTPIESGGRVAHGRRLESRVMKVRASVKKICDRCKVIHRKGVERVICVSRITIRRQG